MTSRKRIAILDDYQNLATTMADWSGIGNAAEITVFDRAFADLEDAASALANYEILCIMRERTPFPKAMFERLPRLELMVTTGMRNAAIDMQAARDHGVTVSGTGSPAYPTAELTWGLVLSLARHIPQEDRAMRGGAWQTTLGFDLNGKTLGVLGLGRLGSQTARIGAAFGMRVIAWSQNLTDERAKACGAARVTKDELLASSDVVAVHLKLSDRTRGLIGADELGRMQRHALLINTSRGPIVDEAALVAALTEGRIGGAGIDVYDREPLPADHPLRACPRTVLTPHIGYVTEDTYRVFYGETVEAVQAYLDGAPIRVIEG